jgi:hypothetical protein
MGYGGVMPPAIGGWGPLIAFLAVASFFGARLRRRL